MEGDNYFTHTNKKTTMLDYTYIEQLLDRYFNCETSLAEEQILRAFFTQPTDDVPAHLAQYRQLFAEQTFAKNSESLGSDFDRRILSLTEGESNNEEMYVKARHASLSRRLRPLYKAAASVAIVLAIGQAAQMPYTDAEAEQRKDFARSVEMLQRIQQDRNTVAQGDTSVVKIEELKN